MNNSKTNLAATIQKDATAKTEMDPWLIWVTFRRTWMWALPIGLILAGISSALVIHSFVPRYRASYILVANEDFIVFEGVMPVVRNLAKSQSALIYNPIVLDPVLEEPGIRSAPSLSDPSTAESNLIKNLRVRSAGTESTLEVSYEDTDPEAAKMVCNAIVESYLRQREAFDNQRISKLEYLLEPEIQRWERQVSDRKRIVESLSKETLGGQAMMESENMKILADLRAEIAELKFQTTLDSINEQQLEKEEQSKMSSNVAPETPGTQEIEVERFEPTEMQIEREIQKDKEVQFANQRVNHYELARMDIVDNPNRFQGRQDEYREELESTEENLAEWKSYLEKAEAVARETVKEQLSELAERDYQSRLKTAQADARLRQEELARQQAQVNATRAKQLAEEQAQRDERKTRLSIKQDQLKEETRKLEQFGSATAELLFAQDEYSVANGVLGKLRNRVAQIRTERQKDGAVRPFAPATRPRIPIEPVPYKLLGLTGVAAMIFPFLLGFLWELRTQRVTDSTMCDKKGLSVIGEIAQLPSGSKSSRSRRVFEESVDTLRASLFLSIDTRNTRSIAVVSSMSGEGKSSVSSQLALSIAKATGETVLLVDGDLRCPDQHDIFGLQIGHGLSGVLSGRATFDEAIDKSLGDRIHVLPAGPLSGSPHRLLSPQKMQAFVEEALKIYKYVVIDTAPVLSAGESLAVASAVDATLLCVMRDLSRMENVSRTTRRLEAVGATLAGTVFSGVTARQYAYRYGDYNYASPEANITTVT